MNVKPHPKIAIIDDCSLYSFSLINEGLNALKTQLVFYGPRKPLAKFYPNCNIVQRQKIWTSELFPFQIFKQVLSDKLDIVHIQHEVNTFGPFYTNLLFPILLTMLKLKGIRVVVTLHSVIEIRETRSVLSPIQSGLIRRLVLPFFFRVTGWLVSTLVVHDEVFRKQLTDSFRIARDKIVVIPHGVSSQKSSNSEAALSTYSNKFRGKHVVLFFGFLSPRKGVEFLLEAFKKVIAKHPDCVLVIAGEAPHYYKEYKQRLETLTLFLSLGEKVVFTGFIPDIVANLLFSISDIVVFPYTHSPSASGPLSTALQFGKAIIATKTRYFANILEGEKDSLLVSPENSEELATAIIRLLDDTALRSYISGNIKRKATQNSWNEVGRRTMALYNSLMSSVSNECAHNSNYRNSLILSSIRRNLHGAEAI